METISKEIITQIRANYLGSDFYMLINDGYYKVEKLTIGILTLFNKEDYLSLKPLSSISDEDAIECLKIKNKHSNSMPFVKIKLKERHNHSIQFICSYHKFSDNVEFLNLYDFTVPVYQYLQSKGYALPYMEYSVDDLVQAGIYKLIDK